jgi:hypothetical protein
MGGRRRPARVEIPVEITEGNQAMQQAVIMDEDLDDPMTLADTLGAEKPGDVVARPFRAMGS